MSLKAVKEKGVDPGSWKTGQNTAYSEDNYRQTELYTNTTFQLGNWFFTEVQISNSKLLFMSTRVEKKVNLL